MAIFPKGNPWKSLTLCVLAFPICDFSGQPTALKVIVGLPSEGGGKNSNINFNKKEKPFTKNKISLNLNLA